MYKLKLTLDFAHVLQANSWIQPSNQNKRNTQKSRGVNAEKTTLRARISHIFLLFQSIFNLFRCSSSYVVPNLRMNSLWCCYENLRLFTRIWNLRLFMWNIICFVELYFILWICPNDHGEFMVILWKCMVFF